ncbi:MAG: hypothetical protein O3B47_03225 [bacterium]|nr:hypothetical protein [bacterium]
MKKICKISGSEFEISDKDMEYYRRLGVPGPTLCPKERVRRRMAVRNERNLYRRKSDMSGETIISMYHSDLPYPVYSKEEWLSDKWDAAKYAQSIDWNRSFFQQFHELQTKVPRANLAIFTNAENSDYCNYVGDIKNCYLCFGSIFIEDCMYGNPYYSKDCVDCFLVRKSEFCYECIDCEKLYHSAYLQECYESSDCFFGYDLKGCRDCFACTGLRKKQYHLFNEDVGREKYEKFFKEFSFCDSGMVAETERRLDDLKKAHSHLSMVSLNCENVNGNYIFNSKNCFDCFQITENEDCSYNIQTTTSKDCYDMNYTEENELCCEYLGNYRNYKAIYSALCYGCHDLKYCDYCTNCKNCFGCAGLRNKQYCILNKQYSKEEYEETVMRLMELMKKYGEWGEFFPIKFSPFAYNETVAQDYFPLSREEVLKRGYRWRDEDESEFKKSNYQIPSDIDQVPDDICNEILACEISGRNYKITPSELRFYKRMKLPIPKKHFNERHKARLTMRLPYELNERGCDKCGVEILTPYPSVNRVKEPLTTFRVLCEKCYLDSIY